MTSRFLWLLAIGVIILQAAIISANHKSEHACLKALSAASPNYKPNYLRPMPTPPPYDTNREGSVSYLPHMGN